MKIGIDSNDKDMYILLNKKLSDLSLNPVDCRITHNRIMGENLKKKIIICQNARIDMYIELNIKESISHDIIITTNLNDEGLENAENISSILSKEYFKDITITDGSKLYVVKNLNISSYLIDIRYSLNLDKQLVVDSLIDSMKKSCVI